MPSSIAPRWRLSAGARYDRYSIDLAHTSPRLGLVHTLTDSTTVKLLNSNTKVLILTK